MTVHTPGQGDLFLHGRADGSRQADLGHVSLDGDNPSSRRQRSNVNHQNLTLAQLGNLGALLVAFGTNAQETPARINEGKR